MENKESCYPSKVVFSECGPQLEEVFLRLLELEMGGEGTEWRLLK